MKQGWKQEVLWLTLSLTLCLPLVSNARAEELFFSGDEASAVGEAVSAWEDSSQETQDLFEAGGFCAEEPDSLFSSDGITDEEPTVEDGFGSEPADPLTEAGTGQEDPDLAEKARARNISVEEYVSHIGTPRFIMNPAFEGLFTEEEIRSMEASAPDEEAEARVGSAALIYHTSIESAAQELRVEMARHASDIMIGFYSEEEMDESIMNDLITAAEEHTGSPKEGDSIAGSYFSANAYWTEYEKDEDGYYATFLFRFYWLTTPEQEELLDERTDEIILSMYESDAFSDYEKISYLYRYLCSHVVYDDLNEDLVKEEIYDLPFTAYAALVNGRAVSKGYALAFYRLALEAGIDCRVISGTLGKEDHDWNIVQMEDLYYNVDSTLDAGEDSWQYFLRCPDRFTDHIRDEEYAAAEFENAYPMSSEDFETPEGKVIRDNGLVFEINWMAAKLTGYEGTPETVVVPSAVQGYPVTAISGNAFFFCKSLTELTLPGTLEKIEGGSITGEGVVGAFACCTSLHTIHFESPSALTKIGRSAFFGCEALEEVVLPEGLLELGEASFALCGNLKSVEIPASVRKISLQAFYGIRADVTVKSRSCEIDQDVSVIGRESVVYGYAGSTAEAYAAKFGLKFVALEEDGHSHVWGPKQVLREAACQVDGLCVSYCEICGEMQSETIPQNDHVFLDWIVSKEPTCTEKGEREQACEVCGLVRTEPLPKLEHEYKWEVITPPTCISEGMKRGVCANCQNTVEKAIVATGVHSYGKWETVKQATVLREGRQVRYCTVCNRKRTRKTAKLSPTCVLEETDLFVMEGKTVSKKMITGLAAGDYVKEWKSSRPAIASVTGNKKGKCTVSGKKTGICKITATLASGVRIPFYAIVW